MISWKKVNKHPKFDKNFDIQHQLEHFENVMIHAQEKDLLDIRFSTTHISKFEVLCLMDEMIDTQHWFMVFIRSEWIFLVLSSEFKFSINNFHKIKVWDIKKLIKLKWHTCISYSKVRNRRREGNKCRAWRFDKKNKHRALKKRWAWKMWQKYWM